MKQQIKFKETEIGMIPEDWTFEELDKHAKVIMGQSPESVYYNSAGNGTLFLQGIRTFGNLYPKYDTWTTKVTKLAKKDSVLLSVRAPVGEVNFADNDVCIGRGLMSIDGKNNKFIFYLFKAYKDYVTSKETGTVYGSVTRDDISKLQFPFPKDEEQSSIAKILSDLDDKIELNHQMNKTLEAMGQALFKRWFVDFEFPGSGKTRFIHDLPVGWRMSKVGAELLTILGGTPSRTEPRYWIGGTVPWINSGKVNEFRVTEPSEFITEEGLNNSATKIMPKKTTIIAITGATLGQVSLLEISACANQSVIGVLESNNMPSEFIYFWIKENIGVLISSQTGGAQQHINKDNVNELNLLCPSKEIISHYLSVSKPLFDQIKTNCFESIKLGMIRDSLLPKLMSGRIRVKEV